MRKIYIKEKLEEIEFPVETLSLGDFDYIGYDDDDGLHVISYSVDEY